MVYNQTCILLPCDTLEDFPLHYEGEEADGLLAAWTALWHPALLALTGSALTWQRADAPPNDVDGLLAVVPGVSEREVPAGFVERATDKGGRVISGNLPRHEIIARALDPLGPLVPAIDAELIEDFFALGYCYLQIELLTRQMRYSTNLDELHLCSQAVGGAKAAAAGNIDTARDQLTACFDLLAQERDHYYAVDAYVIDLTLLSESTFGDEFREQLEVETPTNILLTAEVLRRMHSEAPAALAALRRGLNAGFVSLVGGEEVEARAPLHACETVLRRLREGLASFRQVINEQPRVYGRRRYGLSVLHPQMLHRLGYTGAVHAAFSGGKYPEGSQLKIRWEGPAHQGVDAIARTPLNAAKPATFLSLASKLGETMDMDHVATICFAHWPGRVCQWYHDLRRAARYGAMLGRFVTMEEYFRDTDYPGHTEQFKADQYRSPYLQQAVTRHEPDPISTPAHYWRRHSQASAIEAIEAMIATISLGEGEKRSWHESARVPESTSRPDVQPDEARGEVRHGPPDDMSSLLTEIDATADRSAAAELDDRIEQAMQNALTRVAELVPRGNAAPETGYLVVNPSSHARRASLSTPRLPHLPAAVKPIYATDGEDQTVVVDVPPMGFLWVSGGEKPAKPPRRPPPPLAEENRVFNEFFEAHLNPDTGALLAIYDYERRGNRLSQQLAVRASRPQQTASHQKHPYSRMVAEQIRVTAASTVKGEITATGRLVDQRDKTLATFEQTYRAQRGSRVLELEIQLDLSAELADDPWQSYCCSRVAWANEAALLWRTVNQLRERAEAKRLEAPNYIDIDDSGRHTTLLTGGLPFHRRTSLKTLDTLLIVKGERARSFQLGIGVDLAYPLQESIAQLAPLPTVPMTAPPPTPTSSWLFHIDSRNVMATAWAPLIEDRRVIGFRVRLLEMAGRSARATIQSCRKVLSAEHLDFHEENTGPCTIEDGAPVVNLGANEWVEIAARWDVGAAR